MLFIMPAIFILIMSLAFENFSGLSGQQEASLAYAVLDLDDTETSRALDTRLGNVELLNKSSPPTDEADARLQVRTGKTAFVVIIPHGFTQQIDANQTPTLRFLIDPAVPGMVRSGFRQYVEGLATKVWLTHALEQLGRRMMLLELFQATERIGSPEIAIEPVGSHDTPVVIPSAVQQNVPAWLIFSMFFVSIPISMVFVGERLSGTLQRLRSQRVSFGLILAGKFVPFVLINQIQAVVMVAIGCWIVPLFGGEALTLPGSASAVAAMLMMSLAVSVAAVGWALFIASLVRSIEQGTVFGSVGSILMGAIGGIMVPRFLMPATMQSLTNLSPMGWALEGFHQVMLRQGGMIDVLPTAGALACFGLASLAAAFFFRNYTTST